MIAYIKSVTCNMLRSHMVCTLATMKRRKCRHQDCMFRIPCPWMCTPKVVPGQATTLPVLPSQWSDDYLSGQAQGFTVEGRAKQAVVGKDRVEGLAPVLGQVRAGEVMEKLGKGVREHWKLCRIHRRRRIPQGRAYERRRRRGQLHSKFESSEDEMTGAAFLIGRVVGMCCGTGLRHGRVNICCFRGLLYQT